MATVKAKAPKETKVTALVLVTGSAKDADDVNGRFAQMIAAGYQPYCMPHWYGDYMDQVAQYFIIKEAK